MLQSSQWSSKACAKGWLGSHGTHCPLKTIFLGVWEYNRRARRFYEKNGFYRIGQHIFVMGDDPQTDFLLRKDLK